MTVNSEIREGAICGELFSSAFSNWLNTSVLVFTKGRSGNGVDDYMLDYQSRDHKIDPPLLQLDET